VSANSQQAGPNSEEVRYDVSAGSIRNIRSFNTRITTDATPYEARRAFNFDLSCLTRFGGCRAGCEVMPSAWLDYQEKAKEKGEAVPADELADPRCKNR
jgi:hypothetical protein